MPVKGIEALEKKLGRVMSQVEAQVLAEAGAAAAEILQGGMSMRAPRDTGELASDIEAELIIRRGHVIARVGPAKGSFYGMFQEFGTRFHAAQPFVRPTLDEDGPRAFAVLQQRIRAGLIDAI